MVRLTDRNRVLRSAAATTTLTAMALLGAGTAQAQTQPTLPTGGTVTTGSATIASDATSLTVTQTSARATINFTTFDVPTNTTVAINQPDSRSATLARVTGSTFTRIAGSLTATGTLFLVNPNGISIGGGGAVSTGGGFVASSLNITDDNFNAGEFLTTNAKSFTGATSSGGVSNSGTISANGFAALLGGTVSNFGTISVPRGRVALASGEAVTLDINGANFLAVTMPTTTTLATTTALVRSAGSITGARVELTGASAANAVRSIVNVSGTINADNATGSGGTILLSATGGGEVSVTGSGSLSAQGMGTGPNVATITLAGGTLSYTSGFANTAARGGAAPGLLTLRTTGAFTEDTSDRFSSLLTNNRVTVAAGGAINLPSATWTTTNALTLNAGGDITLGTLSGTSGTLNLSAGAGVPNAGALTATGGINVALFNLVNGNWGQNAATLPSFFARDFRFSRANASFARLTGGNGSAATPFLIADVYGLQGVGSTAALSLNFALSANIDASGTTNWSSGRGFMPIGQDDAGAYSPFTGTLSGANGTNGARFAISGLTINTNNVAGLFGLLGGSVRDLSMTGAAMTSSASIGGVLAGVLIAGGTIANVDVAGTRTSISGTNVGGLVGTSEGIITNARSSVVVSSSNGTGVGGLIGQMIGGSVSGSVATGSVAGGNQVGGLIGEQARGSVSNSSATGAVTGSGSAVGGLVGRMSGSNSGVTTSIANSFATGFVTGFGNPSFVIGFGGLVGQMTASGNGRATIADAYATGVVQVSGSSAGGLVGQIDVQTTTAGTLATIDRSYATGAVSTTSATGGPAYLGGLVGRTQRADTGSLTTLAIRDAYATGAVGAASGSDVGGMVGRMENTTLTNAYATGSASGTSAVGGLVGNLNVNNIVSNVYASGAVSGTGANGLFGSAQTSGTVTSAYWDSYSTGRRFSGRIGSGTPVTSDPNRGEGEANAYAAASYNFEAATGIGGTTPTGFVFLPGGTRPFLAFEVPTAAMTGTPGNAAAVRTIVNAHQAQLIGYNADTLSANYRLTANVDLVETGRVSRGIAASTDRNGTAFGAASAGSPGSYSGMWAPTGFVSLGTNGAGQTWDGTTYRLIGQITSGTYGFSGTLTGGRIRYGFGGLFINRVGVNNTGLFGTLSGKVSDVEVFGANVTGGNGTGAIAGMTIGGPVNSDTGTAPMVSNVLVSGTVTGAQVVGGLVGSAGRRSEIGGQFSGDVTGTNTVGGLVGYANGAGVSGFSLGSVTGRSYVGGAIGYQFGGSSEAGSFSTVTGTLAVGGVVGVVDGGRATAISSGNPVNGPSSADRNFGRVQNGGSARTQTLQP